MTSANCCCAFGSPLRWTSKTRPETLMGCSASRCAARHTRLRPRVPSPANPNFDFRPYGADGIGRPAETLEFVAKRKRHRARAWWFESGVVLAGCCAGRISKEMGSGLRDRDELEEVAAALVLKGAALFVPRNRRDHELDIYERQQSNRPVTRVPDVEDPPASGVPKRRGRCRLWESTTGRSGQPVTPG
jgi:hypothetical protein